MYKHELVPHACNGNFIRWEGIMKEVFCELCDYMHSFINGVHFAWYNASCTIIVADNYIFYIHSNHKLKNLLHITACAAVQIIKTTDLMVEVMVML